MTGFFVGIGVVLILFFIGGYMNNCHVEPIQDADGKQPELM